MRDFLHSLREHWLNRSVIWDDLKAELSTGPERLKALDNGGKITLAAFIVVVSLILVFLLF